MHFKMDAENNRATIAIVLTHKDPARQAIFFQLLQQLRPVLENTLQEKWQWKLHGTDENNTLTSAVYTSMDGVSIFRKDNWPAIISFFKPRMIALDAFWNEVKYGFEM